MKQRGENGQERLGGVEIQERDDAAEADRGDGTNRVQSHVPLRLRHNDGYGRIRGGQFRRGQGGLHLARLTGAGLGEGTKWFPERRW